MAYLASVNSKHKKTLKDVFSDPVSGTLSWASIESLLIAAGCEAIEGNGSRVRFAKDGKIASFHRPHPAKEAKRYQVREAREYLIKLGITP
jgi:hypothetical protein